MSKKGSRDKRGDDSDLIVDLFSVLTIPGKLGAHEINDVLFEAETVREQSSCMPVEERFAPAETCDSADSLEKIKSDALVCTACELYETRTNLVFGEGNPHAKLMFIGEAPGAEEDSTGRPFVGRAGKHLDKILISAGFKREEVYITNILKSRPPENRTPSFEEMKACTPFLSRQIAVIKPKVIALLGNTALKFVIGPDSPGITKIHGQWFDSLFGIPCMPLYHPSYLVRNNSRQPGSPNWQMWQDIQALKKRYDEIA